MSTEPLVKPLVVTDLLDRVSELTPVLRQQAPNSESLGQLNQATVNCLRGADLLHMTAPAELGGNGLQPVNTLQVLEALSIADGSVGWVAMVTNSLLMLLTYLDPATATRLCQDGLPTIAGQGAPNGTAVAVDGGFVVRGRWSYASAFHLADLVLASCVIIGTDGSPLAGPGGLPDMKIFLVPVEGAQPEGNWDVMGLQATGSIDYAIDDVFVPAEHGVDLSARPRFGGRSSAIGFLGWALLGHTSSALGIARHALDEAVLVAKRPKGPFGSLSDGETGQLGYARAEAKLRSARAFAYALWGEIETDTAAARELSTHQQTLMRLSLLNATNAAQEVVAWAYRLGGGTALRAGPLQRCFRDINAATQHFFVGDSIFRDCGRELIGVAADTTWGPLGLL